MLQCASQSVHEKRVASAGTSSIARASGVAGAQQVGSLSSLGSSRGPIAALWMLVFVSPLLLWTPDFASTGITMGQAVRDGLAQIANDRHIFIAAHDAAVRLFVRLDATAAPILRRLACDLRRSERM